VAVVVRTERVTRVYGEGLVRAVDEVDLEIEAGEMVAIMGPSGSGKTTLLNLLGALDTPTEGEVWIEDRPLSGLTERERTELRRHRLGFVFQQFNLAPHLTALENVALPLTIARRPRSERRATATRALELVDLVDRADHLPGQLSGGEQQRVAVARALVHGPALVLADEPTGNLDSATGLEVMTLLSEVRQQVQHAVVMVTHDQQMAALCDRTVRLRDGRIEVDLVGAEGAASAPAPLVTS
jgi:putative ABC transport system ATP-binding protein